MTDTRTRSVQIESLSTRRPSSHLTQSDAVIGRSTPGEPASKTAPVARGQHGAPYILTDAESGRAEPPINHRTPSRGETRSPRVPIGSFRRVVVRDDFPVS